MSFVKNAWYVAGWSRDFQDGLHPVTIVGENMVLYRTGDGTLAALEDRCPHRFLPLSHGRRNGDAIQCGYHGLTFGADGRCVLVPGQDNVPATARVAAYPVHERHGVVWVWTGDPQAADTEMVFDLPELSMPGWHLHHGDALHLDAHYLNVAENLVDPAHVSFVHPTTLGNAASEDVPVEVEISDDCILAWRWIRNAPPVGFFKAFGGFTANVDRWHYYYLHLPSTAVIDFGSIDTDLGISEEDRDKGVRVFAIHFVTPVDEDHTIDHWMHLRNTAVDDAAASARIDDLLRTAFAEDKAILEAIHREEKRLPRRKPLRIAIDKAPLMYRKRIGDLIDRESAAQPGAAAS